MRSIIASSASGAGTWSTSRSCGRMNTAPRRLTGPMKLITNSVCGMLVEVVRLAGLLDSTLVHDHDLPGDLHRLLLVVGDEDRRHVDLVVETAKPLAQLLADVRVQGPERLVEQQHLGLDGERASQRHALALAARELRRVPVAEPIEVYQ